MDGSGEGSNPVGCLCKRDAVYPCDVVARDGNGVAVFRDGRVFRDVAGHGDLAPEIAHHNALGAGGGVAGDLVDGLVALGDGDGCCFDV